MGRCRKSLLSPEGLTPKQKDFANNYIETGNGTQSALKAYNSSYNGARAFASESLANPAIQGYIADKLVKKEVSAAFVLNKLIDSAEIPDSSDPCRLKALELIGKHLRMFTDRVDHTVVFDKLSSIGWSDGDDKVIDNQPVNDLSTGER